MNFDFNGNGLNDIIIIDEPNLVFFFQDPKRGYTKEPHLIYTFDDKPTVFWHAKLGNKPAENILIMTSDGISALSFTDKTTPPAKKAD